MAFDREAAAKKLKELYERMNAASDNQAMRMSNRHLYDDARVVVSQASGCNLGATMRSLVLMGHTMNYHSEDILRHVEDEASRENLYHAVNLLRELTEDLSVQALTSECECKSSFKAAGLIGE